MNYSSNNEKKQDVETSLKYIAGSLKFGLKEDLAGCFEPMINAMHRIANALEEKGRGHN